jgi:hypothetical protein
MPAPLLNRSALGKPRPPHPGPKLGIGEGRYNLLRARCLYLWRYGLPATDIGQDLLALNRERCNPPRSPRLIEQLILDTVRRYPR